MSSPDSSQTSARSLLLTPDGQLAVISVHLALQRHPDQDRSPGPEGVRAVLRRAKAKGLDPQAVYRLAAESLPPAFHPLPPWEEVNPEA